jgi:hypothetical protein
VDDAAVRLLIAAAADVNAVDEVCVFVCVCVCVSIC